MIFGTSCIVFAFASMTVLVTSYASMSAWESGPTVLEDNFEVKHLTAKKTNRKYCWKSADSILR